MATVKVYLTRERIEASCEMSPLSVKVRDGQVVITLWFGGEATVIVTAVRNAVRLAHALKANYG